MCNPFLPHLVSLDKGGTNREIERSMKGLQLGEFEELVLLAVAILDANAYSISVYDKLKEQTSRKIMLSSVHKTLLRLEGKGYLKSTSGEATPQRGGRKKRLYHLTPAGYKVINSARELRNNMWMQIPQIKWQGYE